MSNDSKASRLWQLFATFFRIGAFTFGGGYAMIPLIQKEVVETKKWITDDDILEVVAIAESTPGPIAVNSATFVGYKVCGVLGSLCATLGVILPSFVVITIIYYLLREFSDIPAVQYAFFGIRAGVLALILKALYSMAKKCPRNTVAYVIVGLAFLTAVLTEINTIYIIIACAIIGLITSLIKARRAEK